MWVRTQESLDGTFSSQAVHSVCTLVFSGTRYLVLIAIGVFQGLDLDDQSNWFFETLSLGAA